MKKFKFKFYAVMFIKDLKEKEILKELKLVQEHLGTLINEKNILTLKLKDLTLREFESNVVEVTYLKVEENYKNLLNKKLEILNENILKTEVFLNKVFENFSKIRKEILLLKKMQEKELLEFIKIKNKKEIKKTEDLMLMRNRLKNGLVFLIFIHIVNNNLLAAESVSPDILSEIENVKLQYENKSKKLELSEKSLEEQKKVFFERLNELTEKEKKIKKIELDNSHAGSKDFQNIINSILLMKPKNVAQILNELASSEAIRIIKKIDQDHLSKIFTLLPSKKASELLALIIKDTEKGK